MRCQHCNEKLAVHDLWCAKCGKRTEVLSKHLSATKSLNETWNKYKAVRGVNFPTGIWAALLGALPLIILVWLLNFGLPQLPFWQYILIHSVVWILFVPLLIVPFQAVTAIDDNRIPVGSYFRSYKFHFRFLPLVFVSVVFYLAIFFVCQGDPILNLVWLVLVLYWIPIVLPVPVLMYRYKVGSFKAIAMSYKHAGDVRWNTFLLAMILALANVIAAICLIVGLAVTIPFTWLAIRDYVDRLIEHELFEDRKHS